MKIVWDEPKRQANIVKHGLDFAVLTIDFFVTGIILPATPPRRKAVNRFDGRAVTAVFAPLGTEAIAIVSFRPASATERKGLP